MHPDSDPSMHEEEVREKKAVLDISVHKETVSFNIVFLDTGEIRQKIRSKEWLMKRVFFHELRTWKKNRDEIIEYDE